MRKLAVAAGLVVLASSGAYTFIYLYRWEWNRALFCATLFVAVEVGLMGVMLTQRITRLTTRVERFERHPPNPLVVARLHESRPRHDHFAWLNPKVDQMGVFVPVLMGAGIVLSALAWLIERLASATAQPVMERDLAGRLARLALPETGLLSDSDDPVTLLARPHPIK